MDVFFADPLTKSWWSLSKNEPIILVYSFLFKKSFNAHDASALRKILFESPIALSEKTVVENYENVIHLKKISAIF